MRIKIYLFILLASLALAACQPASSTLSDLEPSEPPVATQPGEAAASALPEPSPAATQAASVVISGEPMEGCRVTGSQLKANPTLEALFPAVNEKDWVIGPSDARVTIIEFSDFQ
jgi:protein-disulfide isomerase